MADFQTHQLAIDRSCPGISTVSISNRSTLNSPANSIHNTSGGQLSCGQAGAAGGFLGLTDAARQLTGAALGKPVAAAKLALVSGFGMINYDRGLCCGATILAAT